jgi:hypothetical protein
MDIGLAPTFAISGADIQQCFLSTRFPKQLVLMAGENGTAELELDCPINYLGISTGFVTRGVPDGIRIDFNPSSARFENYTSTTSVARTNVTVASSPDSRPGTYHPWISTQGIATSGIPGAADADIRWSIMVEPQPDDKQVIMLVRPDEVTIEKNLDSALQASYDVLVDVFMHVYSWPLILKIQGLPLGVNASFDPDSFSVSGSSILHLYVTEQASLGTYNLEVSLTSQDSSLVLPKALLKLTIEPPSVGSHFVGKVYVTPNNASIAQGQEATLHVTLEHGGMDLTDAFLYGYELRIAGLPAGMEAKFNPEVAYGPEAFTSLLTITVSGGVGVGTYPISVSAASKCCAGELYFAPEDVSITVLAPEQATTTTTIPPPGAVPGFPLESIIIGVLLGTVIAFFRNRRVEGQV